MTYNEVIGLSTTYNKTSSNVTIRDNSWTPSTAYISLPYSIQKYLEIRTSAGSKTFSIPSNKTVNLRIRLI